MTPETKPFMNTMNADELKSELSQVVHDYNRLREELWDLNMHRPSAVELEKVITSELLDKAYEMAYFAELLLGEK